MLRFRDRPRSAYERLSAWSRAMLAVSVTVWIGNWVAVAVEPSHATLYLLVITAFALSAARPVPRGPV